MNKIDLLNMLAKNAAEYSTGAVESIDRNYHMNDISTVELAPEQIDALLVDFINFIGVKQGIDYALYTEDFIKLRKDMS